MASRYAALTFDADTRQRATVVREVVDDLPWRRHFEQATAAATDVASEVRPILGDAAKLVESLNTVEKRGALTLEAVTPLGFEIVAAGGEDLAARWIGSQMAMPDSVRQAVVKRTGNDRLKAVQWRGPAPPDSLWSLSQSRLAGCGSPGICCCTPIRSLCWPHWTADWVRQSASPLWMANGS